MPAVTARLSQKFLIKNYLWQRPLPLNKSAAHSSVFDNDSIIMEKRYVTVTFFTWGYVLMESAFIF